MPTARAFKSGHRQAVRLPKDVRVNVAEVEISQRDEETVRRASAEGFERAFEVLTQLPADFLQDGHQDTQPQRRSKLKVVPTEPAAVQVAEVVLGFGIPLRCRVPEICKRG